MAVARFLAPDSALSKIHLNTAALTLSSVVGLALLTAASAAVRIPVPGTPVPITLQTLAVLLAGFTLGPRRGAASQMLYLSLGMTGLPVFAAASLSASPFTGGYLVGFVFAALAVGALRRRLPDTIGGIFVAAVGGTAVIFTFGLAWLTWVLGGHVALALAQGLFPFLPGAVLKITAAVAIVRTASSVRRLLAGSPPSD